MSSAQSITSDLANPSRDQRSGEEGAESLKGAVVSDALATGVIFALLLTVLQRFMGFVRGIFFCRLMTPEELGQFSLVAGGLLLLAPLAVLGLPGTLGRFVEHYSHRGQLQSYLSRVTRVAFVMTVGLGLLMLALPNLFGFLLLGEVGHQRLIWLSVASLMGIAWNNYLTSVVEAMRQVRLASLMRFITSSVLTVGGLILLFSFEAKTSAAVAALGLSSFCGALPAWWYLRSRRSAIAASSRPLPGSELWPRVLPFAAWWWFSNLLHNGYELADRYLLIWMSGLGAAEIQAAAGQLHSAKVLPGLVVNVAAMLSGMLLPFVSAALVRGEPEKACRQLNWTLKLSGLVLLGVNFAILSFAPWLFNFFLRGKYGAGLELLPLATVACSWFSLLTISQDWLWARERGRFAVFSLVLGLGVTLFSGWLLIPVNAAWGAVTATILGNLTALLAILIFNHSTGCLHDIGVWMALTFPLAVLGGPLVAAIAAIIVLYLLSSTDWYFDAGEREEVEQRILSLLQRFRRG